MAMCCASANCTASPPPSLPCSWGPHQCGDDSNHPSAGDEGSDLDSGVELPLHSANGWGDLAAVRLLLEGLTPTPVTL